MKIVNLNYSLWLVRYQLSGKGQIPSKYKRIHKPAPYHEQGFLEVAEYDSLSRFVCDRSRSNKWLFWALIWWIHTLLHLFKTALKRSGSDLVSQFASVLSYLLIIVDTHWMMARTAIYFFSLISSFFTTFSSNPMAHFVRIRWNSACSMPWITLITSSAAFCSSALLMHSINTKSSESASFAIWHIGVLLKTFTLQWGTSISGAQKWKSCGWRNSVSVFVRIDIWGGIDQNQ